MTEKKRFAVFLFLFTLMVLAFPSSVYADVKEIIAEGTYSMGDGETPLVADERALLAAKKTALEQAGTYVESYSATKNYQLTADEVKVIASGIMEVTILDKRRIVEGNNINFWVKIRAIVTTDKIEDMAAKIKDMSMAEDYKRLQDDYDKSQQEITALKQQLEQAKTDSDRQRIRDQITDSEGLFQANTWLEQGNQRMAARQYHAAINAYTEAIHMNPRFGQAYVRRGMAHTYAGEYHEAMMDFDRALDISPQLALAYFGQGRVYEKTWERHLAIDAYRRFLEYATSDQQPYIDIARHRLRMLEDGDLLTSGPLVRPVPPWVIIHRRRGIY